jgi:hypothetical protein
MTTDPARTECTLNDDGRLIIAVGTVAGHTALRAGLPEKVQQCLADAVVRACRETFAVVGNNGGRPRQDSAIRVVIAGFPDRVEAVIEYSGGQLPKSSLAGPQKPRARPPARPMPRASIACTMRRVTAGPA